MPKFNVYLTERYTSYRVASVMDIEAESAEAAYDAVGKLADQGKLIWDDENENAEYESTRVEVEQHGVEGRTAFED